MVSWKESIGKGNLREGKRIGSQGLGRCGARVPMIQDGPAFVSGSGAG